MPAARVPTGAARHVVAVLLFAGSASRGAALSAGPRLARVPIRVSGNTEAATAAAFYAQCFPGVVATEVSDDGTAAEVVFPGAQDADAAFSLYMTASDAIAPRPPPLSDADLDDETVQGLLGVGVELADPDAVDAACAAAGPEHVVAAAAPWELCASMVPDEPPEKETTLAKAELRDPAGLPVVCLADAAAETTPPAERENTARPPAPKVVLGVTDLDASLKFYVDALGMRLLRKRALLPDIAAMSGFVGYSVADDDALAASPEGADAAGAARLELRYVYNTDDVAPDLGLGPVVVCACADPAAVADAAVETGGTCEERRDDGDVLVRDPDGYAFLVTSRDDPPPERPDDVSS